MFDFARSLGGCGGRGSEVEGAQELALSFSGRNSHRTPGDHSLAGGEGPGACSQGRNCHRNPGDHSLACVEEREKEDQRLKQPGEIQGTFGTGMSHFSPRARGLRNT